MGRYSHAIGNGIASIEVYLEDETGYQTWKDGQATDIGKFIDGLFESSKALNFTSHLIGLARSMGGATALRQVVEVVTSNDEFFEELAGRLGLEALYRAEVGADRLVPLLEILPLSTPPEMSKRFLEGAATCYLLELDAQCIVMCRAALEVIVEELAPDLEGVRLGEAIAGLGKSRKISREQTQDMHEINRQAREIMHRTPHTHRPDAGACLKLLARLLAQLHPALV